MADINAKLQAREVLQSQHGDWMLDFETLDVQPSAVCLSMAIARFDINDRTEHPLITQYVFDVHAQQNAGRTIAAHTVAWWLKQPKVAQEGAYPESTLDGEFLTVRHDMPLHLAATHFLDMVGRGRIWTRGVMDQLILEHVTTTNDVHRPFLYRQMRDQRTVVEMGGPAQGNTKFKALPKHVPWCDVLRQIEDLRWAYATLHARDPRLPETIAAKP